jgi:hypothetical protein
MVEVEIVIDIHRHITGEVLRIEHLFVKTAIPLQPGEISPSERFTGNLFCESCFRRIRLAKA